jgi:hypothetical protein
MIIQLEDRGTRLVSNTNVTASTAMKSAFQFWVLQAAARPPCCVYRQGLEIRPVNMDFQNCAIRPEKIKFIDTLHNDKRGQAQGTQKNAADLDEHSRCCLKPGEVDALVALPSQNRYGGASAICEEKPVWLAWSDNAAIILRQK